MRNWTSLVAVAIAGLIFGSLVEQPTKSVAVPPSSNYHSDVWQKLDELDSRLLAVESNLRLQTQKASEKQKKMLENYQARWTHPSTIEDHMATDHKVSIAGKSTAQLLVEHDAIHDKIGPVCSTRTESVVQSKAIYSNCPGGVCPSPQTRIYSFPRLRIFRR
jgi:hypothetical protein